MKMYNAVNTTNTNIEIDGVLWGAGESRELPVITEETNDACISGKLLVTDISVATAKAVATATEQAAVIIADAEAAAAQIIADAEAAAAAV